MQTRSVSAQIKKCKFLSRYQESKALVTPGKKAQANRSTLMCEHKESTVPAFFAFKQPLLTYSLKADRPLLEHGLVWSLPKT
eukprot:1137087-Pelagomonas_calceolata.AAC.2